MNYNSDNSTTRTENSLVENLTKKNAQGIAEMRTDALPVMVPIQEKDWDTMVNLLQSAVDFQPTVYELMRTLLTVSKMKMMMEQWSVAEQKQFNSAIKEMEIKLNTQQTAVENILFQMKNHEQQAGSHLEKVMNDTLAQGKELEMAIAKAQEKTDRRTWLIRTAISVGASLLAAVLSTLLCVLWLA